MIADYEGDISTLFDTPTPDVVPVLATRNLVLFPGVVTPILVGRAASVSLVNKLKKDPEQVFAVFCQKNADIEEPGKKDLFPIGVYAKLVRVLEMSGPGNNITAIVQGLGRCQLEDVVKRKPYLVAQTTKKPEIFIDEDTSEYHTAMEDLRSQTVEFMPEPTYTTTLSPPTSSARTCPSTLTIRCTCWRPITRSNACISP